MPRAIPLEPCVAILRRVAAEEPTEPMAPDLRDAHLRASRLLDVLGARGLPVAPERLLPLLPAAEAGDSVLGLLIELLDGCDAFAGALADAVRARAAAADGLSEEAALGHALRSLLLVPAREIGAYLPRRVVLTNEFRSEELVRAFASFLDAPLEVQGAPEQPERSARVLDRLDYRRIREDEERLEVERTVLAEHAERVRELQRKREAEALASAQRE